MSQLNNPLIFVVEDNVYYNKLIVDNLARRKFTNVKFFLNGEDCIKNMNLKPDIVIEDYNLGGMNGVEVLKRAKKIYPDVEFIFLTAQNSTEIAVNTMRYGAYDYIVKDGVTFDKVFDRIQKIIKMKTLEGNVTTIKYYKIAFVVLLFLIILFFILFYFTEILGIHQ